MPFGLKNAGATYMRVMTTMFHDMMHKEIEVYVDDVIIKSKNQADYVKDLRKFFERLRSRRGIELDPSTIKAIQDLPPPKNRTEVMSLLGRLNYINRFICQICLCWYHRILKPMPTGHLAKWQRLLIESDIVYMTRTAMKAQALTDHLAENAIDEEYEPLKTYFPYEEVLCVDEFVIDADPGWKLFFDRAVNIKGVGIGVVLISELGQHFSHPDKAYIDPLPIQSHDQYAYCNAVEEELDGEYPTLATIEQNRTIKCLASGFFLSGGILYKRTSDLGILRCVDAKEASTIMVEIHSGVCGPHMNGYVLYKKILRADYRTTVRTSTGANPYLLVYGKEVVIPAEVEIPSRRVIVEAEIDDDEWVKTRLEQLILIDEKRLTSPFLAKKEKGKGGSDVGKGSADSLLRFADYGFAINGVAGDGNGGIMVVEDLDGAHEGELADKRRKGVVSDNEQAGYWTSNFFILFFRRAPGFTTSSPCSSGGLLRASGLPISSPYSSGGLLDFQILHPVLQVGS
ncbi:hypothetical protein FXO38_15029 [Capsicum annuum]|nr:hypothetical protein FXO38_15029 [Capsicum annuum]